jgi:UDP-2,3-diacylglucosamine hydrolase
VTAPNAERVILFSDWHLPAERAELTGFFERFLQSVCADAGRVFIVGDLFEAWAGPKAVRLPGHAAALDAVHRIVDSGVVVTVLHGNRDFLLDDRVARAYGFTLCPSEWRGELAGRTVLIRHGDRWAERDRLHKFFRMLGDVGPLTWIAKRLPLGFTAAFAAWWRRRSQGRRRFRKPGTGARPDPRRLLAAYESGVDVIAFGHWHVEKLVPAAEMIFRDVPGSPTPAPCEDDGRRPRTAVTAALEDKLFVMLGEGTVDEDGRGRACYAELMPGEPVRLRHFDG